MADPGKEIFEISSSIGRGEAEVLEAFDDIGTDSGRESPRIARNHHRSIEEDESVDDVDAGCMCTTCDIDTLCVIAYLLGLLAFVFGFNMEFMPRLPYPFIGNLLDMDPTLMPIVWEKGVCLIIIIYGVIYLRKMIIMIFERALVDHPTKRSCPCRSKNSPAPDPSEMRSSRISAGCTSYIAPAILYHIAFGLWIGWACNQNLDYFASDPEYLAAGIMVFIVGEAMAYIRGFAYIMWGEGGGMGYSLLQEGSEVLSVLGLAISSLTMSACVLALFRFVLGLIALTRVLDSKVF